MKPKSLIGYFLFGTCVRYIQDIKEGFPIHGDDWVLSNIKAAIKYLLDFNLQVTYRASADLLELKKELEGTEEGAKLTKAQATKLSTAMSDIRKTLSAELGGFEVYFIAPKRLDVNKLVSGVAGLFAPKVFDKLPDIAKYDMSEAGKCIAFERPTAAAFHLMRATEAVLREFYKENIGRGRGDLMWGPIVHDLKNRKKFKNKPEYAILFNNLDNIRSAFRNPTQHPEKIYDIQEVQDLWGLCVDAITRMAKGLPENPS